MNLVMQSRNFGRMIQSCVNIFDMIRETVYLIVKGFVESDRVKRIHVVV